MNAQEASKIACDKIYEDHKLFIDSIMINIEASARTGYDSVNMIGVNVTYDIKYYFEKLGYRCNIYCNGFDISW